MILKITGKVYPTSEEVAEEIIVDLSKNADLSIRHNQSFTVLTTINGEWYLETDSIKYEFLGE